MKNPVWLSLRNAVMRTLYTRILKPILFLSDPERVHGSFMGLGRWLGGTRGRRAFVSFFFSAPKDARLEQVVGQLLFENPVGLSAGWDYEACLPSVAGAIGFGFSTVGTITRHPYEGNPKPRLGRLPKSRSLLVNKGFKNLGIEELLSRFASQRFMLPVGLSLGKTNGRVMTQEEAVADIVESFLKVESAVHPFSHYELNISCPNLMGSVEFYSPERLDALLSSVTSLCLKKPLFIKMPISETDEGVTSMLEVILRYPLAGIIFGNLQKNRQDPSFHPQEIARAGKGHFSGKPTERRSNELIALARRRAGTQLMIIGCGGVFTAEDAYKKIRLGANLVQLITGMIFEGPQLISHINLGLLKLLQRDGFSHLSEAVGVDSNR